MPHHGVGLFLIGPGLVAFLMVVRAATIAAWVLVGRYEGLADLTTQSHERWAKPRALLVLWGLSAALLAWAVSALLLRAHVLALLGIALAVVSLAVVALGAGVTARGVGEVLARSEDVLPVPASWPGYGLLLLTGMVPYLGWVIVVLLVASGTGAVLDVWSRRERGSGSLSQREDAAGVLGGDLGDGLGR